MNSSGQMKRVAPTIVADGGTRLCRKVGIVFGKRKKAVNGASRLRGLAFFEGFSDAELDRASDNGITAVPTYVINGQWAIPGAQDAATFAQVLRKMADQAVAEMA